MTASEVRDRLDHRFRLLVGSRRGLERHQTLRHAVAWSYDLLDEPEKAVLDRCSVFAGGFDLQSACAVAGFRRPRRLRRPRSAGRSGAQVAAGRRPVFGADPVFDAGDDPPVRRRATRRPRRGNGGTGRACRYFAGRETDILALWDSPRQREAYDWFTTELANLRTAFRWAADHDDLDVAAAIATYAAFLGCLGRKVRADRMGRRAHRARPGGRPSPARVPVCGGVAVLHDRTHRGGRPLQRCRPGGDRAVAATRCRTASRAGLALRNGHRPARTVRRVVPRPARTRSRHSRSHQGMPGPRADPGTGDEARAAANGLIDAAEATPNPCLLSARLGPTAPPPPTPIPPRALEPFAGPW